MSNTEAVMVVLVVIGGVAVIEWLCWLILPRSPFVDDDDDNGGW